jgi:uncharacterized protein (TIGR01777 family)
VQFIIAGGTGLLGAALARALRADHHAVSILTRTPRTPHDVAWDPEAPGDWRAAVARADAVVNLAGESIAGRRWTTARKQAILDSRLRATRALAGAIAESSRPPVFVSGSAVGIYGPRGDEAITEESAPGSDFLAQVCTAWEREANAVAALTRVVLLRTGVVLARGGGALPQMALPFTFFAGGPIGSGRQFVPWIHVDDWVAMTMWAATSDAVRGPLNVTAPNPVRNRALASALGRALHRPSFMPAPAIAIRIALGEMADAVVNGQRVLPAKAQALGFEFRYPTLDAALRALYP